MLKRVLIVLIVIAVMIGGVEAAPLDDELDAAVAYDHRDYATASS